MDKIRIGLYGANGHQIQSKLKNHPDGVITAVCLPENVHAALPDHENIPNYVTLDELLADGNVDFVSLCSPCRGDQAEDAIKCLHAGKHVYAEKPAVLSEADLDRVLDTARACGKEFHEIADSVFFEPYWTMRKLVQSGKIGQVVQVYAQKSYPSRFAARPQDEVTDGGLIRWVGVHGVRFIEHVTGLQVTDVQAVETRLGNGQEKAGIYTAASLSMTLENGGVAAMGLNYLNPTGFPVWGNEAVRVFGTKGMLEITDGGQHTHIYTDRDEGEFDLTDSDCRDFLDLLLRHLRYGDPMPMTEAEELHPLRVVIRAKDTAVTVG